MQDKDQQRMDARMNNFKLKPSENVWIGIEKELRKNKRRPVAWWWTGLLLLLLPAILLVDNFDYKWGAKSGEQVAKSKDENNKSARIPERQLGAEGETVKLNSNSQNVVAKKTTVILVQQGKKEMQSKASHHSKNLITQLSEDKVDPIRMQPINYKVFKNRGIKIADNPTAPTADYEDDFLKIGKYEYNLQPKVMAVPALVGLSPQIAEAADFTQLQLANTITYKDEKNRQNAGSRKPISNPGGKWQIGLSASAFRISQGSFIEGLIGSGAEKSMMDYSSAPSTSVGQVFIQTGYALEGAQRFGLGAVVNFQASKRINLVSGFEFQRRINAITKTTMTGSLSGSGSYSVTQTNRQQLSNNSWAVNLPAGLGIGFGRHFNFGVQLDNALIFAGNDSLRSYAKANNLRGYQPAIGISPNFIIGKKLNWVLSPQLEAGLKRSASGKYNNGLGLRLSYFPRKNFVK